MELLGGSPTQSNSIQVTPFVPRDVKLFARHLCPVCPVTAKISPYRKQMTTSSQNAVFCCPPRKTVTRTIYVYKTRTQSKGRKTTSTRPVITSGLIKITGPPDTFVMVYLTGTNKPMANTTTGPTGVAIIKLSNSVPDAQFYAETLSGTKLYFNTDSKGNATVVLPIPSYDVSTSTSVAGPSTGTGTTSTASASQTAISTTRSSSSATLLRSTSTNNPTSTCTSMDNPTSTSFLLTVPRYDTTTATTSATETTNSVTAAATSTLETTSSQSATMTETSTSSQSETLSTAETPSTTITRTSTSSSYTKTTSTPQGTYTVNRGATIWLDFLGNWTVPANVYSFNAVCVGGGGMGGTVHSNTTLLNQNATGKFGGAGGGLVWANDIPVVPGTVCQFNQGRGGGFGANTTNVTLVEEWTNGGTSEIICGSTFIRATGGMSGYNCEMQKLAWCPGGQGSCSANLNCTAHSGGGAYGWGTNGGGGGGAAGFDGDGGNGGESPAGKNLPP